MITSNSNLVKGGIDMNREPVEKLEKELTYQMRKRRIISGILFVAFISVGIVFSLIREASKEVVVHGEGIFSYEFVTYNEYYAIGILIGFLTATVIGCFLFTDLLFCRFQTAEANTHYITVYRGIKKCSVYVNGVEKDNIGMFSVANVVDTMLPNGTKISVAFS